MRSALGHQWDRTTALTLLIFVVTALTYTEEAAFVAALVTFVVFRPRRRRLIRPTRILQRTAMRKPRMARSFQPRFGR
jgi:threonine/homoserine efflux transporter RhtA